MEDGSTATGAPDPMRTTLPGPVEVKLTKG